MIVYKTGSIFDSAAQCLVNPVNTVGVMGAGLALEFKQKFPDMYDWYKKACVANELRPGLVGFYASKMQPDLAICVFPTKRHYHEKSSLMLIEQGLQQFVKYASIMKGLETAAFPKLGCGLGGLNFEYHVRPLMETYLAQCGIDIEIFI